MKHNHITRNTTAKQVRLLAAEEATKKNLHEPLNNGDEIKLPNHIGNYSKGLQHNEYGEVKAESYRSLLKALSSGNNNDFENIKIGMPSELHTKLTNPQAGLAFSLNGAEPHSLPLVPPPTIDSAAMAGEMVELYWMSMLRDIPFKDFDQSPEIQAACDDLNKLSDYKRPRINGKITPRTIFRGTLDGDLDGPYISQFLLQDIPYGALTVPKKVIHLKKGSYYLTDFATWLDAENGKYIPINNSIFESNSNGSLATKSITNMRELATYVYIDVTFEAYLNAALILQEMKAPLNPGNPYPYSKTQKGFVTLGYAGILSLITDIVISVLKSAWYHKWFINRRLRPEEMGSRVQVNNILDKNRYKEYIHQDLLNSEALKISFDKHGSYLLAQAYPDGCPTHPSYPAGHSVVAGACATALKACFDETYVIPNPINTNHNGQDLENYNGTKNLTVRGEIQKLASNISLARNMAGIHYWSDYTEGLKLGEAAAISYLEQHKLTYNEASNFIFRKFSGEGIVI